MTPYQLVNFLKNYYPNFEWIDIPNIELGLISTNIAFKKSKELKKNPKIIAEELAINFKKDTLEKDVKCKITTVNGYINFDLEEEDWKEYFENNKSEKISKSDKKIILEYICLNVAKPLHVGHTLQGIYGDALKRIYQSRFNQVISNNYWGDWGVQFGILLWGFKKLSKLNNPVEVTINSQSKVIDINNYKADPIDFLVKSYVWSNKQEDSYPNWNQEVRQEYLKLENGDLENLELWNQFKNDSIIEIKTVIDKLELQPFDMEIGESSVNEVMKDLIEYLEEHELWHKDNLGRYIEINELSDYWTELPEELKSKIHTFGRCYLIQSKDGYTTYALRDIAAKIMFAQNPGFDNFITFVGNEQRHHFDQVYVITAYLSSLKSFQLKYGTKVCENLKWSNLKNLFNGIVTLQGGKMSSRKGNFTTTNDLLNILFESTKINLEKRSQEQSNQFIDSKKVSTISLAGLKWFNLNRDILIDSVLDTEAILKPEGNTGVYQLYTIARLKSIVTAINSQNYAITSFSWSKLNNEEKNIVKKLSTFELIIDNIVETNKTHLLCNYLYNIASLINNWYSKNKVVTQEEKDIKSSQLHLINLVIDTQVKGLEYLGINALDKI
jgi:arginyl-tRNA synthetase